MTTPEPEPEPEYDYEVPASPFRIPELPDWPAPARPPSPFGWMEPGRPPTLNPDDVDHIVREIPPWPGS